MRVSVSAVTVVSALTVAAGFVLLGSGLSASGGSARVTAELSSATGSDETRATSDSRAAAESEIKEAVANYTNSIYLSKPELLDASVRRDMRKLGFYKAKNTTEFRAMSCMTFDELSDLARTLKAKGGVPEGATFEIAVLDIADQTAAAKVTAFWGQDYFHLARFDGKWMIVDIMWQSPTQ